MSMTGGMKPSIYQQNVFDFVEKGMGNAVVEAVAGSGKTTTILQSLALIPSNKEVVFLAFNKDIAGVLADRTREMGVCNVECMTLNAMGNRAWNRFRGQAKGQLDANKLNKMARDYRDELEARYSETLAPEHESSWRTCDTFLPGIVGLVRKAKVAGMVPQDVQGINGLLADTDENWADLIAHYDIEFDEAHTQDAAAIRIARVLLRRSVLELSVIDFDDQFYLPLVYGAAFAQPDFLFIDEAQDVSDIQREILARAMGPHTRLIAVGDPHQSIYGFRGANPNSLGLIAERFNAVRLPLSISYRCSQAVVREAQKLVSHIEASATAPEGQVLELGEKFSFADFQAADMVLCRNTAPLVSLAYQLIANKVPCQVKGRDLGQGLIKLIEKLAAVTLTGLTTKLDAWEKREISRLTKKDKDADTSSVTDKAESLRVIMASTKATRVEELVLEISAMFSDEKKSVLTLSTIHKSKGLEASRVFVLNYFLLPSKYAKTEWAIAQENNLAYVAITRAKKTLVFIEVSKEGVTQEQVNGAAMVPQAEAAPAAPATPAAINGHVGTVGGGWSGEVQVTGSRFMETTYGDTTLVKLTDRAGHALGWFSRDGVPAKGKDGAWFTLTGTVKEHRTFRGQDETMLTRCKVG